MADKSWVRLLVHVFAAQPCRVCLRKELNPNAKACSPRCISRWRYLAGSSDDVGSVCVGRNGVEMGVEMGSKWGRNGVEMGSKWVRNGSKMGSKWGRNGVENRSTCAWSAPFLLLLRVNTFCIEISGFEIGKAHFVLRSFSLTIMSDVSSSSASSEVGKVSEQVNEPLVETAELNSKDDGKAAELASNGKTDGKAAQLASNGKTDTSAAKPRHYLNKLEAKKLKRRREAEAEGRVIRGYEKKTNQVIQHITADGTQTRSEI